MGSKPVKVEDYEVEKILKSRKVYGKQQYYIRWKGFSSAYDTWESLENLDCPDLLKEFEDKATPSVSGINKKSKAVINNQNKQTSKGRKRSYNESQQSNQEVIDDNYEVEKIIKCRVRHGVTEYLIRWSGFASSWDTWEPEENLDCPDMVTEFKQRSAKTNQTKNIKTKRVKSLPKRQKLSPGQNSSDNPVITINKRTNDHSGVEEILEHREFHSNTKKKSKATTSKRKTIKPKSKANLNSKTKKPKSKPVVNESTEIVEYEVEKIIDSRISNGANQFLIRWKGFSSSYDTWEPEENLDCPDIIAEFHSNTKKKSKATTSKRKTIKPKSKANLNSKTKKPKSKPVVNESTEIVEYEVEKIIDSRISNGANQFLIRWKGFSSSYDTWEPEENLDCPDIIAEFHSPGTVVQASKPSGNNAGINENRGAGSSSLSKKTKKSRGRKANTVRRSAKSH